MTQSENMNQVHLTETFNGFINDIDLNASGVDKAKKAAAPPVKKEETKKDDKSTPEEEHKILGFIPEKYKTISIIGGLAILTVGGWFVYKKYFKK